MDIKAIASVPAGGASFTLNEGFASISNTGVGLNDLVLDNAGMDPYPSVSISALAERERLIFGAGAAHSTPIAWVLAGGYTLDLAMDELVDLHLETPRAALTAR